MKCFISFGFKSLDISVGIIEYTGHNACTSVNISKCKKF